MTSIVLNNLVFYGFHGVYEYEREQGQRFYFDVELTTNSEKASDTDDIKDAVDYISIYEIVKDIAENKRFKLLEALAAHIGDTILAHSKLVEQVMIKVRKPGVPIAGPIDFVQVSVTRSRK